MAAKKILLVEDDTNLREIYGARLQAEGYDIVSAPDGENALAVAVKEKPDLIISDVMMPKVSGFDMLDILRNAPETKDTKIIMMTALSQAEDKARADKLGADMYLVKSQVTLEDVTKAVHQILDDPSDSAQEADSAAAQEMVSNTDKPAAEEKPEESKTEPPKEPVAEPVQPAPAPAEPATQAQPQPPQEPPKPEEKPANETTPPSNAEAVKQPPADTPAAPSPAATTDSSDDKPASSTSIPISIASDDNSSASDEGAAASSLAVEPSLAQALEDEEKAVQEKIDSYGKPDQPSSASNSAAIPTEPVVESPATPIETRPVPAENKDKKTNDPLDDKPSKKVIAPINDPSKTPDINELIAQEEAKEASTSAPADSGQSGDVIKPQNLEGNTPAGQSSQDNHDDDFGKISL